MRIATWNIKSLNTRRDELLRWLRENQPDVMGLQETKADDAEFVERYQPGFEDAGYVAASCGERGQNGVAILSRLPLTVMQRGLPGQEDVGARLLTVRTAGLSFTTVYVPTASRKQRAAKAHAMERKLGWLDALISYLREQRASGLPAVVCGDFNVAPDPEDDWERSERKAGTTADERSRIRSLKDAGWFDLARELNPDRRLFSWWWSRDMYRRDKGLRLDLMFGDRAILGRCRSAQIIHTPYEDRGRSGEVDHAPVIVDLD